MQKIKNIINQHKFVLIYLPIIINVAVWGSVFGGRYTYVHLTETAYAEGYKTAYEIGRYDQLVETTEEEERIRSCFNISKNQNLNDLLKLHFKDCKIAKTMWAIAQAESFGENDRQYLNTNGTLDCGFLQNNSVHKFKWETKEQFCARNKILSENIKTAKGIYDKQGFQAWVKYNTGDYLRFMK